MIAIVTTMAAVGLQIPSVKPFCTGDDVPKCLRTVERYFAAIDVTEPASKCAILPHLVGDDVEDSYETLPEPEGRVEGDSFEICKMSY